MIDCIEKLSNVKVNYPTEAFASVQNLLHSLMLVAPTPEAEAVVMEAAFNPGFQKGPHYLLRYAVIHRVNS